jgi:hypothetical protein
LLRYKEDGANTSTMEVIDGTKKKSLFNSNKCNKRSCPKQKVARKHGTSQWWTNVFVRYAKLTKISYFYLQICGLDQQNELVLNIMILFDIIS